MNPRTSSTAGATRRIVTVAILLGAAGAVWWFAFTPDKAGVRYRTAEIARGDVIVTVSATGSLKALSTVDIGTQVSGQVLQVNADFNERVSKDQIIARIDPANFVARLTQARADRASARAGLTEAQANLKNAEADFARKTELVGRQLVSRSDLDVALAVRDQARARVTSARAGIEQRDAAVANAELDLTYTEIRAPVDGVVLLRQVEPGQTVAASFQTPLLFQIAEDLAQMQIELAVDESDVGQIRAGQPATFTVDAFPGRSFEGHVRQVRLSATNTQNVITYPVVIDVDNADLSLLPGMTANASIEVDKRSGVLRVPNAALRFKPPGVEAPEPESGAGARRGGMDLDGVVVALKLDAIQRAAYDADAAAMRERIAQRGGQGRPPNAGGGQGGGAPGSEGAPSPETMARRIAERMIQGYAGFRDTLSDAQRTAFDAAILARLSARRATVWRLDGKAPTPLPVSVGISDATHAEVFGQGLDEGIEVLVGVETPAS